MIGVSLARLLDEAHAGQLPALIWHLGDSPIARALRIDLALLVARPELALPALYRRCGVWADDYRDPWWRPQIPTPPPDGLVEEYRTSHRDRLWLTEAHVGVGDHAWERATGKRASVRPPDDDELRVEQEHDAYGASAGYTLIDRGQRRRTREPHGRGAARWGERFLVHEDDDLVVRDAAGIERTRYRGFGRDALAACGEHFATRDGDVIRVWRDPREPLPRRGPMLAANSDRAVLGDALVEQRDQRSIARLPLAAFEGAKAQDSWMLRNDVVIETLALGTRAWRTEDGAEFGARTDLMAWSGDLVAADWSGRHLAIARRGHLQLASTYRDMPVIWEKRADVVALGFVHHELWWRDDRNRTWAVGVRHPHDVRRHGLEVPMRDDEHELAIVDGTFEHDGRVGITDSPRAIASGVHCVAHDGIWTRA